jgi:hypothetical protein
MANEIGIQLTAAPTGDPIAVIRNSINEIWNTVGPNFESYVTANHLNGDYEFPLTQQGIASKYWTYAPSIPSDIPPGVYTIQFFDRIGGSPAESDPVLGVDPNFEWDGGKEVNPNLIHIDLGFNQDDGSALDEYTVIFQINGMDVGAAAFTGSDPDITVKDRTYVDHIPQTFMTQVGASTKWKYDASGAERITDGESYIVLIDVELWGVVYQFNETISRDD